MIIKAVCDVEDYVTGVGYNGLEHEGFVHEVSRDYVFLERCPTRGCRLLLVEKTIRQKQILPPNPFLKYAGGKRALVPQIAKYWKPYSDRRLVELFVGSAAVALGLKPEKALLNDLNPHLINLHRWVQKGLEVKLETQNERAFYIEQRRKFNQLIKSGGEASCEAAELLYYFNRTGFNGLMRFNSKGLFNVSFGKYKTTNCITDFSPWQQACDRWEFIFGRSVDVQCQPNDFIYADPPYDSVLEIPKNDAAEQMVLFPGFEAAPKKGSGFTGYSGDRFDWKDQLNLAEQLAAHRGPALISNAATPRILKLYEELGFKIERVMEARNISCDGSDRKPVECVLAFKDSS